MSILIKGIEMPTGNDELRLIIRSNGQVIISHETYYEEAEAVPVPPHGDLIERDALIDDLKRQCKEVFRIDAVSPEDFWINRNEAYRQRLWQTWCEGFYEYVGSRPTIIPASFENPTKNARYSQDNPAEEGE